MRTNEDAWQMVLEHSDIAYAAALHRRVVQGDRRFTIEEFAGEAMLSMFRIAQRFDESRGVPLNYLFGQYATFGIRKASRGEARAERRGRADRATPRHSRPADSARLVREDIGVLLALLDPRQREVVSRRFGLEGYEPGTQLGIARLLGISQQDVSRIETAALARMREHAARTCSPSRGRPEGARPTQKSG